ncbi:MAG: uroporphyrinogen decarboxylase family protein [Planctomycetota bacterium]
MDAGENLLRAVRFERPERIPLTFHINPACWQHYDQDALQDLMEAHPLLFPCFERRATPFTPDFSPWQRAGEPYVDDWGCTWETSDNGITGAVTRHPLADWSAFDSFTPPDPDAQGGWDSIDWTAVRARCAAAKAAGQPARGGLRHGHTFLTLTYIRGYENLLFDMVDEHPRLPELIGMVEAFNLGLVQRFLDAGADWMGYPEDLGMQVGPMISPALFHRWIRPVYERIMAPAREAGCVIHMHSDGDLRDLYDDLVASGVEVFNLQDLVNGIDWIRDHLKGKVCIDLDLDRQNVTRFGTPDAIRAHVRHCVETLGSPEGGLMLLFGLYPGAPLENVAALMDAMETCSTHHA